MRHLLSTLLLGPVLVYQGQQVKKRVLRLPEPPGDRAGVIGEGPALSVLIVGDSSGAGVGASHQDEA
ncbi:MAG: SGNH/GDSL hydrolase family protein, partial [Bacteroidota bacterium]